MNSPQLPSKASQVKKLISRLEAQSPPSTTSSSRSIADPPRRQPRNDAKLEAEQIRGAPLTSQSSFDTLKVKPEKLPEQDSKRAEDELPAGLPRESTVVPPDEPSHSQTEAPPHPPVNHLASPTNGSDDQHPSPLDALLSPTTSSLPHTPSLPRDSVADSDLGEVRLDDDDDERFSAVSLDAAATRDSTVAVKSPIDEEGASSKPWTEDELEPPPAPSETSGTAVRASLLLQRIGNDGAVAAAAVAPGLGARRSVDGQQKLQEVFERAQRNSKDLEDEAGVDWGTCSLWAALLLQIPDYAQTVHIYSVLGFCRVRCVFRLWLLLLPFILMGGRLPRVRFGELGAACPRNRKRDTEQPSRDGVAAYVINNCLFFLFSSLLIRKARSASKDSEMEATYLKFLKESSPHEKAITRDLGR